MANFCFRDLAGQMPLILPPTGEHPPTSPHPHAKGKGTVLLADPGFNPHFLSPLVFSRLQTQQDGTQPPPPGQGKPVGALHPALGKCLVFDPDLPASHTKLGLASCWYKQVGPFLACLGLQGCFQLP